LVNISLKDCSKITDIAIIKLAQKTPNLKKLNLSWCFRISDASINHLVSCNQLEYLDVTGCPEVTGKSIVHISKYCHNLSTLGLNKCSKIDKKALEELEEACPCIDLI